MARSGDPMFELPDAPRLLQVDSRQDALHFVDPAGETPGRRPVAKLRR
jgi:hypothetical protein